MSDNQKIDLYIEDGGNYLLIDPKTVASAVKDESINDSNVQEFIDNGATSWEEANSNKQYVSATLLKGFKEEIDETLSTYSSTKNLVYDGEIDTSDITDNFSSINLPIKKGTIYKITGDTISYRDRVYKSGDFIIFNRYIEKTETTWYENVNEYTDIILGYGNNGLGIKSVVANVFETKSDLDEVTDFEDFQDTTKTFIVIVANDERHNGLISYYKYCDNIDEYIGNNVEIVNSEEELSTIKVFNINPQYDYNLDLDNHIIILNEYIDNLQNLTIPEVSENENIFKTAKIVGNPNIYYKWNGNDWVYLGNSDSKWLYMFSHYEPIESEITNDENLLDNINDLRNDLINLIGRLNQLDQRVDVIENNN